MFLRPVGSHAEPGYRFVPEIENGEKPFPVRVTYVRLHDVSPKGCKVGSRLC